MLVLASTAINPTVLSALQVLHIIAAIYFGLGVLLAIIFALQVPNTPGLTPKAKVMGRASAVALRMVVPGAVLAGALGVAVTVYGRYWLVAPNHGWLIASIVLYALVFLLGGAIGPMGARLRRRVDTEARGGKKPTPELLKALRSPVPLILNGVNVALTLALVYVMIFK